MTEIRERDNNLIIRKTRDEIVIQGGVISRKRE
jgi:hypothetical protein